MDTSPAALHEIAARARAAIDGHLRLQAPDAVLSAELDPVYDAVNLRVDSRDNALACTTELKRAGYWSMILPDEPGQAGIRIRVRHPDDRVYTLCTGMEGTVTGLFEDWGYDPGEHDALIHQIAAAAYEEAIDIAHTMMREAGLANQEHLNPLYPAPQRRGHAAATKRR